MRVSPQEKGKKSDGGPHGPRLILRPAEKPRHAVSTPQLDSRCYLAAVGLRPFNPIDTLQLITGLLDHWEPWFC